MTSPALIEQLDFAIDALMAKPERALPHVDPSLLPLLTVAAELRSLPRPSFRTQLKADLLERAAAPAARIIPIERPAARVATPAQVLPTLFGAGYGAYAVQGRNFAVSFVAHVVMIAFIATSGLWLSVRHQQMREHVTTLIAPTLTEYVPLPADAEKAGGGGGGGDRDKFNAPNGRLPRFSTEQFTPPAMVIRNRDPKLPMEPTVVAPPQLQVPSSAANYGDPMSRIFGPPSNGTGSGGGIGTGDGGGVGSGRGPGVGPGWGGGIGGGVYKVGGGVSAPRAVFAPDPEYSEEARKAKYQGTVVLWVVVGPDGRPHDMRVQRSLGMGLDEKAIAAVREWRFEPSRMNGQPVAVQINIEVSFRLY